MNEPACRVGKPNKQTTDENYRYAFQGQEKDGETGMEAFELRLWDGRLGRWLSPDPYGEFFSPYLGMGNNPLKFVDVNGGQIYISFIGTDGQSVTYKYMNGELYDSKERVYTGNDSFLVEVRKALRSLDLIDMNMDVTLATGFIHIFTTGYIRKMVWDNDVFMIRQAPANIKDKMYTNGSIVTVDPFHNPDIPVVVDVQNFKKTTLKKRPFKIGLIHELAHAYDYKKKVSSRKEWFSLDIDEDGIIDSSVTFEEQYASSIENIYRGKFGQSLRNYYINGVDSSLLINNLLQTIWTDANGNKKACDCGN